MAFCLASGATYLLNDVQGRGERPPQPAHRLDGRSRAATCRRRLALSAAALAAGDRARRAALVNWESLAALGGYIVLQLAYSNGLKHVLFLDVMAIAAGFVLRAAAGGLAIDVPISSWLLLCTGLLAMFLGFTKRRARGGRARRQRPPRSGQCSTTTRSGCSTS